MYSSKCTPIFVKFGRILVRKLHIPFHAPCLFLSFEKNICLTQNSKFEFNVIFLHFQKHTALSLLFRQRGMFLFFWISDFLCKFGILCKGRSVEIFHRKIVNQELNINIHEIFESYRIFKSLVFYWVVRSPLISIHMTDWSVGPLVHWSVGP